MTPEERRRANLSVLGIIARGMGSPEAGSEALALTRASRAAERKAADDARRTAAAEAEMSRIAGRLFGGTPGNLESLPGISGEGGQLTASNRPRTLESLPGEGGEGGQLTARYRPRTLESLPGISGEGGPLTSRYRQDPMEAMSMLYRSQAGRDAARLAPDLAALAKEGTLGSIVGGSVVNRLTGKVTTPAEAPKPKIPERTVDLGGQVIVYFNDGTSQTFSKGMAPGARAAGGGERFKILSAAEVLEAGLKPGSIYQKNTVTGLITPMQGQDSGGLGETELRQYNAATLAIRNARSNIQNFADTLTRVPATGAIAGEGRGELEGSYTLALGAVRELQNSGVLNVGEIPFLEKALRDPTTFSSIMASPVRRKEIAGQIKTILTLLNQRESNLNNLYFPGKPPPQNATPSAANPVVPTNQNRSPSPETRSRAANYYQEGD